VLAGATLASVGLVSSSVGTMAGASTSRRSTGSARGELKVVFHELRTTAKCEAQRKSRQFPSIELIGKAHLDKLPRCPENDLRFRMILADRASRRL
jgi:hypothetical protein